MPALQPQTSINPQPLPDGVTESGGGDQYGSGAEPGFWILLLAAGLVLAVCSLAKGEPVLNRILRQWPAWIAAGLALVTKVFYSHAGADELLWVLGPRHGWPASSAESIWSMNRAPDSSATLITWWWDQRVPG
jgi:hypothetical protein